MVSVVDLLQSEHLLSIERYCEDVIGGGCSGLRLSLSLSLLFLRFFFFLVVFVVGIII